MSAVMKRVVIALRSLSARDRAGIDHDCDTQALLWLEASDRSMKGSASRWTTKTRVEFAE
jgi:hypothetical protein